MKEEEDEMRQEEVNDRFYKGKYRLLVLEKMLDERYPVASR